VVTPTNWNASPRDDYKQRGPIEEALINTPVADIEQPIEVLRVVHSFDPCLACSVHLLTPEGQSLARFRVR
jgi:hydrogenase large subunit